MVATKERSKAGFKPLRKQEDVGGDDMSLEEIIYYIRLNVLGLGLRYHLPINLECPISLDDLINCIIMENIYHAYIHSLKKASLQENFNNYPYIPDKNDLDSVKTLYRLHRKLQEYRKNEADYYSEMYGLSCPDIYQSPLSSGKERREGLDLTSLQFAALYTTYSYPILESITQRKLVSSKNFTQERFIKEMNGMDKLKEQLIHCINIKQDILFNTFMLYELEWKYHFEFLYAVALKAEKRPTSHLNIEKMPMLMSRVNIEPPDWPTCKIESRFLISRMRMVPVLFDEEKWDFFQNTITTYLKIKSSFKYIPLFIENGHPFYLSTIFQKQTSCEEWEEFCLNKYNMGTIYSKKQWNKDRIATVRRIYDSLLREKDFYKKKKSPNKASDSNSVI